MPNAMRLTSIAEVKPTISIFICNFVKVLARSAIMNY